ncbi:hypothetical protein KUH03_07645 [Sphingobacterium sp. E70]|uniref:hypothetical protein n=1 Tax=Sphingobacterium sp. E70 TaxID=2853439 RepID=UPI00211B8E0C|nr:hypothetical protein [Sphingobacterium sp. E70]ULT26698.1 hypothetical protein KUH03_07645 [Sphingobacterium sp. E70]
MRTSDATRAATVLNNAKFSVLRTDGQTVVVKIADDNQFDQLIKCLVQQNIEIYGLESHSADLEQIFINLISRSND